MAAGTSRRSEGGVGGMWIDDRPARWYYE